MFCPKCGKEINDWGVFCKYCGVEISKFLSKRLEKDNAEREKEIDEKKEFKHEIKKKHKKSKSAGRFRSIFTDDARKKKVVMVAMVLIILLAFIVRFYYINANNAVWWDEAEYLLEAKRLGLGAREAGPYSSHRGILLPIVWSFSYMVGLDEIGILLLQLIVSVLTVYFTFVLGKKIYNNFVGIIAALMMAVFWQNIFWTNRFLTEITSLLFAILSLIYFWEFYVEGKKSYLKFFVCIGLGILTRFPTGIMLICAIVFVLLVRDFSFLKEKKFYIGLVVFVLLASMIFVYAYINHGDLFLAINQAQAHGEKGGLGVVGTYIAFMPGYLLFLPLLLLFLVIFKMGMDIFLSLDLLKKSRIIKSNLFVVIVFVVTIISSGLMNEFIPRMILNVFPIVFIIIGKGAYDLYKYKRLEKLKIAVVVVLVLLFFVAIIQHVSYADMMIEAKANSFTHVKDVGEWIGKKANDGEVIMTGNWPMVSYYSKKRAIDFPSTEKEFDELRKKMNIRYIILFSEFAGGDNWEFEYVEIGDLEEIESFSTGTTAYAKVYEI